MREGGLSRAVVVHGSPARHCFLSLPRSWAALVPPAHTPTFLLELPEMHAPLALSWAGQTHTDGEDEVYISRVMLTGCGVAEGETGVLTYIHTPPPVTDLTVMVEGESGWQDLALNAEAAQSAFLSQVRIIAPGQGIPLWLAGGACVKLSVLSLTPNLPHGVLQPMTRVEVLPPADSEEGHTSASVTFTPDSQDNTSLDSSQPCPPSSLIGQSLPAKDTDMEKNIDSFYTSVFSYIFNRYREHKTKCNFPRRKDVQLSLRVVPVPCLDNEMSSWSGVDLLYSHPTLVIVSQRSVVHTAYKDDSLFLASMKKIKSPRENAETSIQPSEESKTSEESKSLNSSKSSLSITCTVIVWENFASKRSISERVVRKMQCVLQGNNCLVPNSLRRLMKLNTFTAIELELSNITTKSMPVIIEALPLVTLEESKAKTLCEEVKGSLQKLANEFTVIVNPNTLMELRRGDDSFDVLLRYEGDTPLLLTSTSAVLLDITLLKSSPSDLPHIQGTIDELNSLYQPKFSYLGDVSVFGKLKNHILLSLGSLSGGFNVIVHGSRGSGKTSLVESLVECLSSSPHHFHCEIVSFKQLKGKKAELVEKRLQMVFREAIFRRPSVIMLEDLDFLMAAEEQESSPAHDHTLQLVTILQGLLDQLSEVLEDYSSPLHPNALDYGQPIIVVGTCLARTSVHPLLVNPQGRHYFPTTFPIPPLDSEGRLTALKTILKAHMKDYCNRQSLTHCQSPHNCIQEEKDKLLSLKIQIDGRAVLRRMENFVFPDLSHLALRTFLEARHRWQQADTKIGDKPSRILSTILSLGSEHDRKHESSSKSDDMDILTQDVEAALEGYTPLALRGVSLSEETQMATFEVGGLEEAQRTLEETLAWPARYPGLMGRVKIRLRAGVLLYGPPGSGKTLLAHAVATACKLNFITVKGPELLSKYIGASEAAVRDAFQRASQARPCVLFFDEFESVGGVRGRDSTGVTDRVVNQLLTQLDGAEEVIGVSVLAATSRPDLIDPALLRPGRLDKCVLCPLPSESDRAEILRILSSGVSLGEEMDWDVVAGQTEHFSGADLQSLLATAQVIVAQEALGEDLYRGVITSDSDILPDSELPPNSKLPPDSETPPDFVVSPAADISPELKISPDSKISLGSDILLDSDLKKVQDQEFKTAQNKGNKSKSQESTPSNLDIEPAQELETIQDKGNETRKCGDNKKQNSINQSKGRQRKSNAKNKHPQKDIHDTENRNTNKSRKHGLQNEEQLSSDDTHEDIVKKEAELQESRESDTLLNMSSLKDSWQTQRTQTKNENRTDENTLPARDSSENNKESLDDITRTGVRPKVIQTAVEQVIIEKERDKVRYKHSRRSDPFVESSDDQHSNIHPVIISDESRDNYALNPKYTSPQETATPSITSKQLYEEENSQKCTNTLDFLPDVIQHKEKEPSPQKNSQNISTLKPIFRIDQRSMEKPSLNTLTPERDFKSEQQSMEKIPQPPLTQEEPDLKIYQRHIDAALKEVRPSVSAEDRLKYERLYATFTKSREGSFAQPTPGRRTTMA